MGLTWILLILKCYDVVLGTRTLGIVYFPVKNAILMNPVTPMERVLVARLGIVVGHFWKGAKICLRTEAELLPHSQWEPLVVQHKGRYIDCHMAHSLEMRAFTAAWQHSWFFCLLF